MTQSTTCTRDAVEEILRLGAADLPLIEQHQRFRQAFPHLTRLEIVACYQEAARRSQAEVERLQDEMLKLAPNWQA